jgi:hypothetical protein
VTQPLRAAVTCLAIATAAAILSFRPIYEPDLWWHLAHGREDAAGRTVRTNVFSAGFADYRQQFTTWLFDTTLYAAWTGAGPAGVQLVQFGLLVLTLGCLYAACRVRAPAWSAAAVLMLGFFILEPRAIPRPHLVSFAGMAAVTLAIERAAARQSLRPLVWTIPGVALWSNFHVECLFGVAAIGMFAFGELVKPAALSRPQAVRAMLIAAACGLATMANPYGWGLAAYLYENMSVPRILAIAELRPPYLPDYRAFFAYAIAVGLALAIGWRSLRLSEALLALTFGALGLKYLRLTPLLLLVTAPMLASRLAILTSRGLDYRALLITSACLALTLSRIPLRLLATEIEAGTRAVAPPRFFSEPAIAFIERTGLEGPIFNSHNLGGYLAWELYPRVRVFQDSRLQAYPPEHFRRIMTASASQDEWNALVAAVDWAIISVPRANQLSGHGRFPRAEWGTVYQDDAMEIVVRRKGKYGSVFGVAQALNHPER